jgi:hypothetical protein
MRRNIAVAAAVVAATCVPGSAGSTSALTGSSKRGGARTLVERFDGVLSNPAFWYFSPTSYFPIWPTDGELNQAARVTACAVSSPGVCVDGAVTSTSSTYGQLAGIESHVTSTKCSLVQAGYASGDCSTTGAVGRAGDETWYRYKMRFPSSYKPTPGTQNVTWELHVDRGTEADAKGNVTSTLITVSAGGDPRVLCSGVPRFCTTPGTRPSMILQVAGGLDTKPLYPAQVHRYAGRHPVVLGHWYDVVLHFVFSPDPRVGHVQWWLDGVKQIDTHVSTQYQRRDGTLGYFEDIGVYNYRYWANWASSIDYDELSWGPTSGSVRFTRKAVKAAH